MQQTNKYQLNLIETSDTFSPAPLNENMEKVEAAISAGDTAEAAARAAETAALDQRVQVLELRRFATGYYIGNGEKEGDSQIIQVGFTPVAVITNLGVCVPEFDGGVVKIIPGGFKVTLMSFYGNSKGGRYAYFAFA